LLSAEPASSIDPSKHREGAVSLAGMSSVLVVDDEPGIRNFLQRGLGKYFSLVETAGDVEAADELLRRCHFDLIIADIRLPGCNSRWSPR